MSATPVLDYDEVLTSIRSWPAAHRLRLAEAVLGSLRQELDSPPLRGVPVEKVFGIAAGSGPAPDDETVRRWIEEHRQEKYR